MRIAITWTMAMTIIAMIIANSFAVPECSNNEMIVVLPGGRGPDGSTQTLLGADPIVLQAFSSTKQVMFKTRLALFCGNSASTKDVLDFRLVFRRYTRDSQLISCSLVNSTNSSHAVTSVCLYVCLCVCAYLYLSRVVCLSLSLTPSLLL
jgi:hypothetical protein